MSDDMEKDEVYQVWCSLMEQSESWQEDDTQQTAESPDHPINQWLNAREIDFDDLSRYTMATADKVLVQMMRTGVLDGRVLAAYMSECFQVGFEVAAKRYLSEASPL